MNFKKENIVEFLITRGWLFSHHGNLFEYYKSPPSLKLGDDFLLEIPNDASANGFQKYSKNLVNVVFDIYGGEISLDDIHSFFTKTDPILSLRIIDDDTKDGSIKLDRLIKTIENIKGVFKNTVTFLISEKQIFGDAKLESDTYLNNCRALQTEFGSFVAKIQMPSRPLSNILKTVDSLKVSEKLFDIIKFTDSEIINPQHSTIIDKAYIANNKEFVNVELLTSIRDLYKQAELNNIEVKIQSSTLNLELEVFKIKSRITYFNKYISQVKDLLLEDTPLETIGRIKTLSSVSPTKSNLNEVMVEGEISGKKEKIKVILDSTRYLLAVDAHAHEHKVKVIGIAKISKSQYFIKRLDVFEIIK
ncbi:hypothetical protein [uncultured Pedobacter sp.]|uniref:hypothetical protein n=1 Tax=uncultured Pedobacter sp. TaxID=246139 RepID=UPI0025E74277|nr:hypothetical protein [uncultured Pedobacter sp.]